jgi:hypothetical protein
MRLKIDVLADAVRPMIPLKASDPHPLVPRDLRISAVRLTPAQSYQRIGVLLRGMIIDAAGERSEQGRFLSKRPGSSNAASESQGM